MTDIPAPRTLTSSSATAAVTTYGAHVTSWVPNGFDPVLWVSKLTKRSKGDAIRGGVPLCFPWFGPGRSGDMKPAHGFARITDWRLVEPRPVDDVAANGADAAVARLALTHEDVEPQLRELFPHEFEAVFAVDLAEDLTMSLAVTNTGSEAFEFEQALHTYLAVGDSRRITIEGLDGAHYFDKTTQRDEVQSGAVSLTQETDRVYHSRGTVSVKDPVADRTITVAKEGSANTVVWNPWEEKARGLSDVEDDAWQFMVCVETANALENAIRLEPGESHTMTQRLTVSRGI